MKVNSIASLLSIPIGTKLKIVRNAKGECPASGRVVRSVSRRFIQIEMTVDDTSSKYNGQSAGLPLMGHDVVSTENGFQIVSVSDARVFAEYEFADSA